MTEREESCFVTTPSPHNYQITVFGVEIPEHFHPKQCTAVHPHKHEASDAGHTFSQSLKYLQHVMVLSDQRIRTKRISLTSGY